MSTGLEPSDSPNREDEHRESISLTDITEKNEAFNKKSFDRDKHRIKASSNFIWFFFVLFAVLLIGTSFGWFQTEDPVMDRFVETACNLVTVSAGYLFGKKDEKQ